MVRTFVAGTRRRLRARRGPRRARAGARPRRRRRPRPTCLDERAARTRYAAAAGAIHLEDALTARRDPAVRSRSARRSPARRSPPARSCCSAATWASATPRRPRRWSRPASGCRPSEVIGRGTGIDDGRRCRTRSASSTQALARVGDRADDPVESPDRARQRRPRRQPPATCWPPPGRRAGAARRADLGGLRAHRRPDRPGRGRVVRRPGTARPSRPSRSPSPSSASSRSSTSACGWARAAARSPPYPCCAAPSPCCATSRC